MPPPAVRYRFSGVAVAARGAVALAVQGEWIGSRRVDHHALRKQCAHLSAGPIPGKVFAGQRRVSGMTWRRLRQADDSAPVSGCAAIDLTGARQHLFRCHGRRALQLHGGGLFLRAVVDTPRLLIDSGERRAGFCRETRCGNDELLSRPTGGLGETDLALTGGVVGFRHRIRLCRSGLWSRSRRRRSPKAIPHESEHCEVPSPFVDWASPNLGVNEIALFSRQI